MISARAGLHLLGTFATVSAILALPTRAADPYPEILRERRSLAAAVCQATDTAGAQQALHHAQSRLIQQVAKDDVTAEQARRLHAEIAADVEASLSREELCTLTLDRIATEQATTTPLDQTRGLLARGVCVSDNAMSTLNALLDARGNLDIVSAQSAAPLSTAQALDEELSQEIEAFLKTAFGTELSSAEADRRTEAQRQELCRKHLLEVLF